jgi:hypothetical protein
MLIPQPEKPAEGKRPVAIVCNRLLGTAFASLGMFLGVVGLVSTIRRAGLSFLCLAARVGQHHTSPTKEAAQEPFMLPIRRWAAIEVFHQFNTRFRALILS